MSYTSKNYQIIKKKYLKFVKSQEVLSEPFRDKIEQLNNFYFPICKSIYENFKINKKTKIVGLTGGQGSGKSTISKILKIILNEGYNLNTITFSIDDFYKKFSEREVMSKKISPLFKTRGVPGTHDTKLLMKCLKNLKSPKFQRILIPKFDKSIDDRLPKNKWQKVRQRPDIVIFEGWCVGAIPQKNKSLVNPINVLEKKSDKKRIWRNYVNKELKTSYNNIFKLIDKYIFLKVPSFKYVYKWRLLQEKKLISSSKRKKIMDNKQIKNFIMFYERITKNMIRNFTNKAHITVNIDNKHRLRSIKYN